MLPITENYAIYPAVVKMGEKTEMTITATERAFFPVSGEEYALTVIAVEGDELDYHLALSHEKITLCAEAGVLRFRHTFSMEGEYLFWLYRGEKKIGELHAYSLGEDLYGLLPLRGDFHSHSFRSDGKRDPAALAGHFREQGYDLFALTDHNRFYPGGEIDEAYQGVRTGVTRIRGEEVHAPGCVAHIVHALGDYSVAEQYLSDMDGYRRTLEKEYFPRVPADIPAQYRERYAITMWVTERIHAAGGLAIFPHPYWRPTQSQVYNVRTEFARILLKSGLFDAYELVGGMKQDGVNVSLSLWQELRAEGFDIPVVGSSDVHGLDKAYTFPHYFTLVFAENSSHECVKEAILSHRSVAVEATGAEYERQYRAYGKHRLVIYAQFLFRFFFPVYWRLTQGEGIAMRAYAMGEAPASLVEQSAALALDYRARFFGKKPPILPTETQLAFEEKWRARHLEGPTTKGSTLDPSVITRQI